VLGAPLIINRASGAVTLEAPLTLPASNPTDANHAARKAYVDAEIASAVASVPVVWEKLADAAVTNSTVIDITGFNLQNYRQIIIKLLGAQLSATDSVYVVSAQVYRNSSLVNTGYTFVRLAAVGTTVAASTTTNSTTLQISWDQGFNTDPIQATIALVQSSSSARVSLDVLSSYTNASSSPVCHRVSGFVSGGSGWANGLRINASVAFQNNVGRIVVLGLKP
jgi:hypothetical protein